MTLKKLFASIAVLAVMFVAPVACNAAAITNLVNTGQGLAVGDLDTRYQEVAPLSKPSLVINKGSSEWTDPVGDAKWIWVQAGASNNQDVSIELQFTVNGLGANQTLQVSGEVAVDNGTKIYLGADLILEIPDDVASSYKTPTPVSFSIATDGAYTLRFDAHNGTGPAGLLVQSWTENVVDSSIPEPMSLLVWGILGGLGLIGYRRRRK